ncbi:acyl-CoA carboxylase epsilon subunit [Streptomyces meridianus]|uniref:Acyl-CoA carboxylase subunit epsilon n=1 Tax=Streptomyces meridianus TaxID=2938945 RepID=A0ABT0X2D6_9ACTN|nr:acyl-CoA carboxylase epsilon subunit [Streptomyces meridianus]MCM2576365.1 acyl-CoA carboxylase subunit epsilon [Streptomyces meridianus]
MRIVRGAAGPEELAAVAVALLAALRRPAPDAATGAGEVVGWRHAAGFRPPASWTSA